jgi:predicted enzyme related to lactoylglutathione lyase
MEKSGPFYEAVFNWTRGHAHNMGPMGNYQMYQIGGKDIGGMMKKMDFMPMSVWNYYIWVDGIDAASTRIASAGGKITNGPMQVPTGQWVVNAQDPQGAHFSLLSNTK